MSARPIIVAASLLAHGAIVYTLGEIRVEEARAATAIEVVEAKEKPKPPPVPIDEPPPERTPQRSHNQRPADAPPPDAPPTPETAALSDLPDFGLDLSGGGPGGFAVAQGTGPLKGPRPAPVQKSLTQTPAATPAADTCTEPPAKPKLVTAPQPAYTDAARAAAVEGKVRLQLIVDENGKVIEAKVVAGLGHGLDEAALAAARSIVFEGAVRCGKPSRSTVNFAFRFSAL